jgi:DNA-binding NarL/FixJ family response regulator
MKVSPVRRRLTVVPALARSRQRQAAPEAAPEPGLRTHRFALGGERFAVLSFPVELAQSGGLSDAERDVLQLLLTGLSNLEIATHRRSSTHTVAKQVSSIFRKLGVRSRAELMVRPPDDTSP